MQVQARFVVVAEENHRAHPFEWYLVLKQEEAEIVRRSVAPEQVAEYLLERPDGSAQWGWAGRCPLGILEPAFPGLTQEIWDDLRRQGKEWQRWVQDRESG